jgi:hypothetical protein
MRSRSKKLLVGIGSFFLAASLVAPSFAAKQAISDNEMDNITAAGEPTVIGTVGSNSGVSFSGTTSAAFTPGSTSQNTLTALILNNIVGENQVANGLNVTSGTAGAQANTITQSWGSLLDSTAVTAAGGTSVAGVTCAGLFAVGTCNTSPGSPGSAATTTVLTTASNVIINTVGATSPVTYNPNSQYAIALGTNSQSTLSALIVNNVAGLNQVANGVNISAFTTSIAPAGITLGSGSPVATNTGQTNTINQFQGVPAHFTRH